MADETKPDATKTIVPDVKPGYLTSEGWVQAATQLLAIVVGLGLMTKGSADSLGAAASSIGAAVTALASAWAAIRYSQHRTELKSLEK